MTYALEPPYVYLYLIIHGFRLGAMLDGILQILSNCEHQQSVAEYWGHILKVIGIARFTDHEKKFIDCYMTCINDMHQITTSEDCYSHFVEACKLSQFRPTQYWEYLLGEL
eukprot:NODE_29_length_33183_cov_0.333666.p25 type:complete len:111 gc:universal NODE_29_length_33183_cov_0.333666:2469-2137(-)